MCRGWSRVRSSTAAAALGDERSVEGRAAKFGIRFVVSEIDVDRFTEFECACSPGHCDAAQSVDRVEHFIGCPVRAEDVDLRVVVDEGAAGGGVACVFARAADGVGYGEPVG